MPCLISGTHRREKENEKQKFATNICVSDGQTAANLEKLAQMDGQASLGRTVDKLVREKMLSLRKPEALWQGHRQDRSGRCE